MHKIKNSLGAMVGTALELYDKSLYGFLAPTLVGVFLPSIERVDALILAFGMYPLSLLATPWGALFFGRIGDKFGRKKALSLSILGMAFATGVVGLLPTYASIGWLAPISFVLLRLLQCFFAAGEYNGGAIFALEHVRKSNRGIASGWYCFFAVLGICAASLVVAILAYFSIERYWRIAYLLAFLTAVVGFFLRRNASETPEFLEAASPKSGGIQTAVMSKKILIINGLCMIGGAGFFSALYTTGALFLTAYVPIVSSISSPEMLEINTIGMWVYVVMLVLGGWLADRFGMQQSMKWAAFVTILASLPLFWYLITPTVPIVYAIRIIFGLLCGWFVGPFHAWAQGLFPVNYRYRSISLCYAIGSRFLANLMPSLSFILWKQTHIVWLPGILLVVWGVIGWISIHFSKEYEKSATKT